jgi:hypothetical protein
MGRSSVMSQPEGEDYGPEWEAEEVFGSAEEPLYPFDETSEMAAAVDDDLPPDPAIDERDLLDEPPS